MRCIRVLPMLLAVSIIAGCGFHLRGSAGATNSLGVGALHVSAPRLVRNEIEAWLSGSDARLVKASADADLVLRVLGESFSRRVLAVDPVTGKEREFELNYTLRFDARRGGGEEVLAAQRVSLVRDFVFDRDALIGVSREQAVLENEMRRDAVEQVMRRLAAAASK